MATKKAATKKAANKASAKKSTANKMPVKAPAKKVPAKSGSSKSAGKGSGSKGASKGAGRRYSSAASKSVEREMKEMHEGKLTMGRSGKKVTNPKQAIAIGLSEARRSGAKVPPPPKGK